jgi:hypothetical protein
MLDPRFPFLTQENHEETSPVTPDYNCIAWAAGNQEDWWWPTPEAVTYWPPGVPRVETCAAFVSAFQTLGYQSCDSGDLEAGFEKLVLYVDGSDKPTHMARQLPDGKWTSKMGSSLDMSHTTPEVVGGPVYGAVNLFLKRPNPA